jgi:hypothetical protein
MFNVGVPSFVVLIGHPALLAHCVPVCRAKIQRVLLRNYDSIFDPGFFSSQAVQVGTVPTFQDSRHLVVQI